MNLLFRHTLPLEDLVYSILLSDTRRVGRHVESRFSETTLQNRLTNHTAEEVSEALDALDEKEWIYFQDDEGIVVARMGSGGNIILLSQKAETFDALSLLKSKFAELPQKAPQSVRILVKNAWADIKDILNTGEENITTPDLLNYYASLYTVSFQEKHRKFMAKEAGQMKGLLRLYSPSTILDLITEFLGNLESYTSTMPKIGLLLHHKDDIYGKVKKLKAAKISASKYTGDGHF